MKTLPSFGQTLEKLSFKLTQKGKQEVKAERHFETPDPDWNSFVKNLKSKHFQDAVKNHPQADEKLQAYVKNYGGYLRSKDHVATLTSADSGRSYRIKRVGSRLGCNCGDWQYKKSVQGGDCKHIKSLKQSKMKLSSPEWIQIPKAGLATRTWWKLRRALTRSKAPKARAITLAELEAEIEKRRPPDRMPMAMAKGQKMKTSSGLPGAVLAVYKYPEILGEDAVKHKKKIEKKVDEILVPLGKAKEAFVSDLVRAAGTVAAMNAAATRKQRHGQAAAMNAKQLREQERQKY